MNLREMTMLPTKKCHVCLKIVLLFLAGVVIFFDDVVEWSKHGDLREVCEH